MCIENVRAAWLNDCGTQGDEWPRTSGGVFVTPDRFSHKCASEIRGLTPLLNIPARWRYKAPIDCISRSGV